jgi:hypothetical protein
MPPEKLRFAATSNTTAIAHRITGIKCMGLVK